MDRRRFSALARVAVFAVFSITKLLGQTTINVPADQPTIQAAINAASPGDTVLVAPGTYFENIDFMGKAITVTSSGGAAVTTIDGSNAGSVVIFHTNEGQNSILSGFTITHGRATSAGGGIEAYSASPIVENNIITQNQGCGGGNGVYAGFSSAIIRNNTITNNTPAGCTGGMGGGVAIGGAGSVQLLNNVITGNSMPGGGDGGGVGLNAAGTPTIAGNVIQGNSAYNDGGGIAIVNASNAFVIQNLITGNTATSLSSQGGGINVVVPSGQPGPIFVNNTIANNTASQGSAAYLGYFYQQTQFVNNLMIGASGSPAVYCGTEGGVIAPILKNNDAFSPSGVGFANGCSSAVGTNGNISSDPLFVNAAQNDFHLQPGSPAIDAGDITNPHLPAQDLSGAARLGDDSGQCNFVVDLGVYESHPAAPGALSLSSVSLGFPDTAVGSASSPLPLVLTGTGQGCFRITGFNLTSDFSQANSCGSGVPAGQSCTVQVTFTPRAAGLRNGTLSIPMNTNTGTAPGSVALSGTGLVAHGTPSPTSLSFPGQNVNTSSAAQTITLTNDGGATLTVSSVSIAGDFTQTNNCSGPIAPGASCSIQVTFTPTANGQRNGSLSIASNSSPAVVAVSLTGTGLGPQGSFSPTGLSFAAQPLNMVSQAQNVVLTNVGALGLSVSGFSISGDYAQTNNCPGTLAPNTSCSIQVTFTPTASGQRSGTLSIVSNSSPAVPNVSLIGSGLASQGTLSPATLSFALQLVNTTSPAQNVVLKNVGTLPLNISGFSISGDYVQTNNCPGALASNASCSIQVTFTPTVPGVRPGVLSISSDSAPAISSLSLNGTGAPSSQATINVPADQPTIQAAINAAADGATVLVAPGTYVENVNFAGKAIVVTSSGGATSTIIDGNAAGSVVTFNQGESSSAVLNGFTIRNGRSGFYAGGIQITGASPQITNNVITGNGGTSGVAINVNGGSPLIQGNTITDNVQDTGTGGGGAIYISAASGVTSNVSVIGNVITNNHLDGGSSGGGISLNYFASALIENNYIAGNSAYNGGGGIDVVSDVPVTIVGNVIVNNSSGGGGDGGGIYLQGTGQVLVLNNTFYGNTSSYNGTSEIATWVYPPNAIFKNNIVYATSGTAITCPNTNGVLTATNNIIYSLDPATNGTCAAFSELSGNIFTDPGMVDPVNGGFHLRFGSPAIDAGVSDPNLPATDIGGTTRVLDGNNDGVAVVDIGAYEFVPGATPTGGLAVLSPSRATFPATAVGSSGGPVNFTLLNNGNAPLSISSISVSTPFLQTNNCPAVLSVNVTCLIQVTFTPTGAGNSYGFLRVNSDAVNGTVTASLNGTGIQAVGTITPASFDWGQVPVGGSTPVEVFEVTNPGTVPLVINTISASAPFEVNGSGCYPGISISPGGNCGITVTFHPSTAGSYNGTLVVTAVGGGTITPAAVNLSGTGVAPTVSLSTSSVTFPNQLVGTLSPSQQVTLTNNGPGNINISSFSVASPFAQNNNCPIPLAGGASCTIYITFTPGARGSASGLLSISSDAANSPVSVSLAGTGIAPVITATPQTLSFSSQLLGSASPAQPVTLSNTGDAVLSIGSIAVVSPFAQTNNCGASLAVGANCTINVTFSPTSQGAASGSLIVNVGAPATNQVVALSGTGIAPTASMSTTSLTFPMQRTGTTSSQQVVTLSNTGNSTLTISSIAANGAIAFAQTNSCPASLAPGNSCSINVTFAPIQSGTFYGNVTITDDSGGASGSTQEVFLTGTGGSSIVAPSPAGLTFSTTKVGTSSTAAAITVANTGTMSLNISSISATGDFSQSNNCGTSVAAGGICTVNVVFTPAATGSRTGGLTISSDASNGNAITLPLSGTGALSVASLSPGSLTFAATAVGTQSAASAVTLSNTGLVPMNLASIAITGDFIQSNNCSGTIAASSSCTISVVFVPTASGTRTGVLTITDDASGGSQVVSLSGSASDFSVTLSPASATIHGGKNANYNAIVSAIGGAYNQAVALACSGLPAGATCTLTPTSLIPGSSSQTSNVKITTSNGGTPAGTYTIIVTGAVNNAVRSGTATLIVK